MVTTINTIKISEMTSGGDLANDDITPGLRGGENVQFNNPWTFLSDGTTGDRPVPSAANYYRLRFNTTLEVYEYYDPTTLTWTQLSGSGTGTVNPGVANDIAFYAANGQAVSAIAGAANSVLVTSVSGVPSLSTTLPTGLSIPGAVITASLAALLSGSVAASPVSGTDLTNKTYVDALVAGTVLSIIGTTNQVIASSPTGNVTLSLPQDIAVGSTPTFGGLTLTSAPLGGSSGGTGVNNGSKTITLGGNLITSGAFASTFTMTGITGVTFPTSGTLATTSQLPTPAALTKVDDTNVTLTLGGTPATALLQAASLTLGWTGQLGLTRGGSNASLTASNGGVIYSTASAMAVLAGTATANLPLLSGVSSAPSWGAFPLSLGGNFTTAAAHTLSGAFASTFTLTGVTGVTFPTSGTLATTSQIPTGAALTKTDDTNVTLTLGGSPTTSLVNAASLTMGWTGILSKARGGTSVGSATIAATSLEFAAWDTNLNLSANNFLEGFRSIVSAAGTTVLTVASAGTQEVTGVTTQTIQMPVTSTLVAGHPFYIINNSSGNVTLNSSGGNAILVMAGNTTATVTCVLNSGTTAASWNASYVFDNGAGVLSITGTANQVIASASTGAVTLSLPQSIATTSDLTFNSITWSDTTKGIVGTTTNNSAATGYVGEVITNNATGVALTANVYANITSISLTAGDWDVFGSITYVPAAGTTTTYTITSISTVSATQGTYPTSGGSRIASTGSAYPAPTNRISIAGTTTVYLVGLAQFATSTMTAGGLIFARRRR